eukprot:Polyplicarium_translucidae@DN1207_c0_g1_i1.p1
MNYFEPTSEEKRCGKCTQRCNRALGVVGASSRCLCCLSVRTGLLLFSVALLAVSLVICLSMENLSLLRHANAVATRINEGSKEVRISIEKKGMEMGGANVTGVMAHALRNETLIDVEDEETEKRWEASEEQEKGIKNAASQLVGQLNALMDNASGIATGVRNWFATFFASNVLIALLSGIAILGAVLPNAGVLLVTLLLSVLWLFSAVTSSLIALPIWCAKWGVLSKMSWTDIVVYYAVSIALLGVPVCYVEQVASFYRIFKAGGSGREMKSHTVVRNEMRLLDDEHRRLLLFVDTDSGYEEEATPLDEEQFV